MDFCVYYKYQKGSLYCCRISFFYIYKRAKFIWIFFSFEHPELSSGAPAYHNLLVLNLFSDHLTFKNSYLRLFHAHLSLFKDNRLAYGLLQSKRMDQGAVGDFCTSSYSSNPHELCSSVKSSSRLQIELQNAGTVKKINAPPKKK